MNYRAALLLNKHMFFFNFIGSEEFFFERVALAFPKDSPWIEHFNIEIKRILQANISLFFVLCVSSLKISQTYEPIEFFILESF